MNNSVKKAEKIAKEVAEKFNLEIVSVNFVLENGIKILRIIADKEFGLTMEDSESLNIAIGEALDLDDISDEEYYLEVSSVGAERELKTERELTHAIGRFISVETTDGTFIGDLVENNEDSVVVRMNNKGRMSNKKIEKINVKEIRLALKF